MDISKKQHLPTKMFGEDQADGAFEEDKELDEMDNEAHDPSEKEEDDINDEEGEEEQDPDSDKDKA